MASIDAYIVGKRTPATNFNNVGDFTSIMLSVDCRSGKTYYAIFNDEASARLHDAMNNVRTLKDLADLFGIDVHKVTIAIKAVFDV